MGGGIDDVDDVKAADGFLCGDLRGIDGGGTVTIDDFANFLLMRDGDFDYGAWRDLDAGLDEFVEAFFFDAELIHSQRGGKGTGNVPRSRLSSGQRAEATIAGRRGQRRRQRHFRRLRR